MKNTKKSSFPRPLPESLVDFSGAPTANRSGVTKMISAFVSLCVVSFMLGSLLYLATLVVGGVEIDGTELTLIRTIALCALYVVWRAVMSALLRGFVRD